MNSVVSLPRVLGITGGIGSGKSYVAELLQKAFAIPIYDTDMHAKQITATNSEIKSSLQQLVGSEVYENGILNKAVLSRYLFTSDSHAAHVNAIIHPQVKLHFVQWLSRQTSPLVVLESAILFESGFHELANRILFVDAPIELRLKRAMLRDASDAEQIKARMARQKTEYFKPQADYVIENNSCTDEQLIAQLRRIVAQIISLSETNENL